MEEKTLEERFDEARNDITALGFAFVMFMCASVGHADAESILRMYVDAIEKNGPERLVKPLKDLADLVANVNKDEE